MIDLQIALRQFLQIDEAPAAVFRDQRVLDDLRQSRAPRQSSHFTFAEFAETIRRDLPPVAPTHAKRLNRDAILPHVARGARRMIIAVAFLQFLGRDVTVLEDVINDRSWTLCGDLFAKREQVFREFRHRAIP